MTECAHAAPADPRKQGSCVKCGRPIPAQPARPERDREFERAVTREIGRGLHTDALTAFAESRADGVGARDYGHGLPAGSRNLELEALEELADCRNYLVWSLDLIRRDLADDDDRTAHLQLALRSVIEAFESTRAALRRP